MIESERYSVKLLELLEIDISSADFDSSSTLSSDSPLQLIDDWLLKLRN